MASQLAKMNGGTGGIRTGTKRGTETEFHEAPKTGLSAEFEPTLVCAVIRSCSQPDLPLISDRPRIPKWNRCNAVSWFFNLYQASPNVGAPHAQPIQCCQSGSGSRKI
jgi:hypothetical protein